VPSSFEKRGGTVRGGGRKGGRKEGKGTGGVEEEGAL